MPDERLDFWETMGFKAVDVHSLAEGEVFLLEHGSRREACRFIRFANGKLECVPVPESFLGPSYRVLIVGRQMQLEELD